jgi:hypothetical protein
MRPAAPARETLAATAFFIPAGCAIHLRLRAGDEGGQAIDAAGIGNHRLRLGLRLILRLRAMLALAMMFARLLVALVGYRAGSVARIVVANEGCRCCGRSPVPGRNARSLAIVVAASVAGLLQCRPLRLVLPELPSGRDQAEIMFGVLVVILGRDWIAGRARAAPAERLFGDVRGGAADFDIGPVDLNTRVTGFDRAVIVVVAAIVVIVVVIPVTHPLVVLTVSHVSPLFQP